MTTLWRTTAGSATHGCADLVYTGKGALIWMPDIRTWASDVARLLSRGGHLFVHEAHPMVPLYAWDPEVAACSPIGAISTAARQRHLSLQRCRRVAVEPGEIVTAISEAGLGVIQLVEHPEPFWRPANLNAAVWNGQLPNTFSLLARRL